MPLAAQHLGPTCCRKTASPRLSFSLTLSLSLRLGLDCPWLWCGRQVLWLFVLLWWVPALHLLQCRPACLLRGNTSGVLSVCVVLDHVPT